MFTMFSLREFDFAELWITPYFGIQTVIFS